MKKSLVAGLILAMCLGLSALAPVGTNGAIQPAAFSDIAGHPAEGELTLLGAMGVFTGDAGSGGPVKPDDPITRAEFCKVVVTVMGRGTTAAGLMGLQPTFTDGAAIPAWAWGYVNVAVYLGIITGYADGSFGPANPVTYAEAVTMLIRAVPGHDAVVGPGLWPYNYLFYGVDNGFTGAVDVGFSNLPCTRGDMARLVVATMQIDRLNAKGEVMPGTAVLSDVVTWADADLDETKDPGEGTHTGNLHQGVFLGYFPGTSFTVAEGGFDWNIPLGKKAWIVGATSYDGLVNLPVFVVKDADGAYFIWVVGEANTVTGVYDEAVASEEGGPVDTVVLEDGTKVPYNHDAGFGVTLNRYAGHVAGDLAEGDELILTLGDDGLIANAIALRVNDTGYIFTDITKSVATPAEVDTMIDVETDSDHGAATFTGLPIPETARVLVGGLAADRDALARFDFVQIYRDDAGPANAVIEVRAYREIVEGKVVSSAISYPGALYHLTVGDKTYGWDKQCLGLTMPGKDARVKYGLDPAGELFVPIGFEPLTPYVAIRTYTIGSDGNLVTVDVRGEEASYADPAGNITPADVGKLGRITVEGGLEEVMTFVEADFSGLSYSVLAVDPVNKNMTLRGTAVDFVTDPVVYKWDAAEGVYAYVPLADVAEGWLLWRDQNPNSPLFVALEGVGGLSVSDAPGALTAGGSFTLDITARTADGDIATGYGGPKALVFSGASAAPDGTAPTATPAGGSPVAFGLPTTADFVAGQASVTITLYRAETATVAVTDGANVATAGSTVVSVGEVAALGLNAPGTAQTAGVEFAPSLRVTTLDAYDNLVDWSGSKTLSFTSDKAPSGQNPQVYVSGPGGGWKNMLLPTNVTVNFTSGLSDPIGVRVYAASATTPLTVSDGSLSGGTTVAVNPGAFAEFLLHCPASTAGTEVTATITARDTWHNTISINASGVSVTWSPIETAPDGVSSTSFTNPVDFANGVALAPTTFYKAGTGKQIEAVFSLDGGTTTHDIWSNTFGVTVGPVSRYQVVVPASCNVGETINVHLHGCDAYLNLKTSYKPTKRIDWSGAPTSPAYSTGVVFASGEANVPVTMTSAGTFNLTATAHDQSATGTSDAIMVNLVGP